MKFRPVALPPLDLQMPPPAAQARLRAHLDIGGDSRDRAAGELFAQGLLDVLDLRLVDPAGDRGDDAVGAAAGGTAGAVDVVLHRLWHVEVDDMAHARD